MIVKHLIARPSTVRSNTKSPLARWYSSGKSCGDDSLVKNATIGKTLVAKQKERLHALQAIENQRENFHDILAARKKSDQQVRDEFNQK